MKVNGMCTVYQLMHIVLAYQCTCTTVTTFVKIAEQLLSMCLRFRIMTPQTCQRASFKENRRAYTWPIMQR